MTAVLRSEKSDPGLNPIVEQSSSSNGNGCKIFFAAVLGITCGALALWCTFDHSVPSWDAAGHLLNGLAYRDLFRHAKPFDLPWYHQLLTVNCFYPPFTYLLTGAIKTVAGVHLWTDSLMKVVYLAILNVSVFGLISNLTKDRLAAVFAVLALNLYPEVNAESHKNMLDFPVMSMAALSLWSLTWWNEKRDWKRAAVVALATGCALMTKQVCAAFLVLPFAFYALRSLRMKKWNELAMIVSSGIAAGSMLVPWLIVSSPTIKKVASEIQVSLGNKQVSDVFFSNVASYLGFIPAMMTPFLLIAALGCIAFVKKESHKHLAMLWLSALSGIILLSTLTWQYALPRYFISALIVFAAYSGIVCAQLWKSRRVSKRATVAVALAIGILGHVAINFYPNPIPSNQFLDSVRTACARPVTAETKDRFEHPCPDDDWGIGWVLSEIRRRDGDAPVWLNVLPSTQQLNVHAFDYYAHQAGYGVKPTTSRSWSAAGDSSQFNEEDAMHYQWYLVKTGEQGFKFTNKNSRAQFDNWQNFIATSGKFDLVGEKRLPDDSVLSLYRQR